MHMSCEYYMLDGGILKLTGKEHLWVLYNSSKFHGLGGGGTIHVNPNPASLTGTDEGLRNAATVLSKAGFKAGDLSESLDEKATQTLPLDYEND